MGRDPKQCYCPLGGLSRPRAGSGHRQSEDVAPLLSGGFGGQQNVCSVNTCLIPNQKLMKKPWRGKDGNKLPFETKPRWRWHPRGTGRWGSGDAGRVAPGPPSPVGVLQPSDAAGGERLRLQPSHGSAPSPKPSRTPGPTEGREKRPSPKLLPGSTSSLPLSKPEPASAASAVPAANPLTTRAIPVPRPRWPGTRAHQERAHLRTGVFR